MEESNFSTYPLVGKNLPELELEIFHQNKIKKVNLSKFKGRWLIILFYPADFTFICPTELEEAATLYSEFKRKGAEILSMSTDTVFVHKAWYDRSPSIKKIKFPMGSDPAGKLSRKLGVYLENEGLTLRATFIIDPRGKIKAYEVHDNSIGRSIKEILRKFEAAKFVNEHKGLVCPASWRPGKKPLKPNLKLVGKI